MNVEIDISDVVDVTSDAVRALNRFDDRMARICQRYIDRERNGHAYENRSHNAETHTNAVRVGKNEVRCEMAVDYASYLQRSKSGGVRQWSHFEDYMKAAQHDINELAKETADKAAR